MAPVPSSRVTGMTVMVVFLVTVNGSLIPRIPRAVPGQECGDNAPNCNEYALADLCTNPVYTDWVFKFCRLTCSLCEVTPPVHETTQTASTAPTTTAIDPSCRDKLDNCKEYQYDMCTNPFFVDWAREHCSHFCNFCTGHTTPSVATTSETPHPDGLVCFDRMDCASYDVKTSCCGDYEPWARHNCARHCKFCKPVITEAPLCTDTDDKCSQYGADLCSNPNYDRFVREHCARTCRVCEQPEFIPQCAQASSATAVTSAPTSVVITTSAPGVCADLMDCSGYDIKTSCCGAYEAWARHHCPKHCKFCVPDVQETPLCHDTDPLCDQYGSDLCTNPSYDRFIHEHCAGTCKVCNRPMYIPPCTNTTVPPIQTPDCYQDSKSYSQGSSWDTPDCSNHCTCVNGLINDIKCDPIVCPSPVPNCDLVHIPGHCCPILHGCRPVR